MPTGRASATWTWKLTWVAGTVNVPGPLELSYEPCQSTLQPVLTSSRRFRMAIVAGSSEPPMPPMPPGEALVDAAVLAGPPASVVAGAACSVVGAEGTVVSALSSPEPPQAARVRPAIARPPRAGAGQPSASFRGASRAVPDGGVEPTGCYCQQGQRAPGGRHSALTAVIARRRPQLAAWRSTSRRSPSSRSRSAPCTVPPMGDISCRPAPYGGRRRWYIGIDPGAGDGPN